MGRGCRLQLFALVGDGDCHLPHQPERESFPAAGWCSTLRSAFRLGERLRDYPAQRLTHGHIALRLAAMERAVSLLTPGTIQHHDRVPVIYAMSVRARPLDCHDPLDMV